VHKANLYFLKSVEFAKKANAKVLEAFALKGFADIYATKGKYSESLKLFEEAKNLSERTGDLILKERIYKGMCDNYLALQNVQEYQIYNQKYLETKFKREQNQLNSISQTINNQRIEKNKQIELIKLKYQNLNIFLILFSLILCFGFLYLTIKKRNANAVLKKKVL
jgi:tetratricopeptide (TPR) repeat protein